MLADLSKVLYPKPDESLKWLYKILIKPVEKDLIDVEKIIICPHWFLNIIPFAALLSSNEGDYLVKSRIITYSPSASIWGRLRDIKRETKSSNENTSLVVGVEQIHESKLLDSIERFLDNLVGGSKISDFEEEATDIALDLNTTPIIGSSANKDTIINRFQSSDIVHFSCHTVNRSHPLINGLLFADGVLSLAEILTNENIGASNPSIISLSACRSGVDRVEPGDTIWGLGYGFLARCAAHCFFSLPR